MDKEMLFEAISYIHFESFKICHKILGYTLPNSGNIGVFCHFEDEFERLTKIRKDLTLESDNWNNKYFRLIKPIIIPNNGIVPKTTYTYLYIRKQERTHLHVGDMDFYLQPDKYMLLKKTLQSGKTIKGLSIFDRPDLDLLRLSDPKSDVSVFVGTYQMKNLST
jgi:hypothetical protein